MPSIASASDRKPSKGVDFARALAERPVASSSCLRLHARAWSGDFGTSGPFAVLVPKRLVRSAVLRNALKRRLREAFRAHQSGLTALELLVRLKGFDLKAPKSVALRAVFDEAKRLFDGLAQSQLKASKSSA